MTILDLRIKYRFDTGLPPTYGKYDINISGNQRGCNYKGSLTNQYGEWLESHFTNRMRLTYQKETGLSAILDNTRKGARYTTGYKLWLEEAVLSIYSLKGNYFAKENTPLHIYTKE